MRSSFSLPSPTVLCLLLSFIFLFNLFSFTITVQAHNFPFSVDRSSIPFASNKFSTYNDNDKCTAGECQNKEGDACFGELAFFSPKNCSLSNGTCCAEGLVCNQHKCSRDDFGTECSSDYDCSGFIQGNDLQGCINGRCQRRMNAGEKCQSGSECYGNMVCSEGRCRGQSIGDICTRPKMIHNSYVIGATCAYGLYCAKDNTCKETVDQKGSHCTDHECGPGLYCNQESNKCVKRFSLGEGEPCDLVEACQPYLTCSTETKKCIKPKHGAPQPCEHDDDCGKGNTCKCSPVSGKKFCNKPFLNPCNEHGPFVNYCGARHKCTSELPNLEPGSCMDEHCHDATEKLVRCAPCEVDKTLYGEQCTAVYLQEECNDIDPDDIALGFFLLFGGLGFTIGTTVACLMWTKRSSEKYTRI